MYKNFTESSYTSASSYPEDGLTSQNWTQAVIIHSCHIPNQKVSERISNGGQASSNNWSSFDQSPNPYHFTMLGHSLMQAWALELQLLLESIGEHGVSSLDGKHSMAAGTSVGPRPLDLNYLQEHSSMQSPNPLISSSMGTTLALSKDGGMGGTKILKSTRSLSIFICSSKTPETDTHFTPHTFKVNATQQMAHQGASTLHQHSFFHPYHSLQALSSSSLTQKNCSPQLNRDYSIKESTPQPLQKLSMLLMNRVRCAETLMLTTLPSSSPMLRITSGNNGCHNAPLQATTAKAMTKPHPYQPGLTPNPSHL